MERKNDRIIIEKSEEFDIKDILECGQIFSFDKDENGNYYVLSADKKATIVCGKEYDQIITKEPEYFYNFFDLDNNYLEIKNALNSFKIMEEPIKLSPGIRIVKQDIFETIISFVISANNNIPRIKNTLKKIRQAYGKDMGDYFAFPTCSELKNADEEFFQSVGCGYRSSQIVKLLKQIENIDIYSLKEINTKNLKNFLISLSGIGPKVADCILLFGFSRKDVFPVDTWISKVWNDNFQKESNRIIIANNFVEIFKDLSGYAQQYLFDYKRKTSKKN